MRQSEGNRAAKRPCAAVASPKDARFRDCAKAAPESPLLMPCGKEALMRVVSPVLLKTSLPRPAPGQAPAERIVLSITGSPKTRNCLGSGARFDRRLLLTFSHDSERRSIATAETSGAAYRLQKEHREDVFFQRAAATRAITIGAATVWTSVLT